MGTEERTLESELYFLVYKFLSASPCKNAASALREEIEKHLLLPKRLVWTGERADINLDQFAADFPHISTDYLLRILARIPSILDRAIPPSVPGVKSLLGNGSQSLLRTTSGTVKK